MKKLFDVAWDAVLIAIYYIVVWLVGMAIVGKFLIF